ncbi:MAG: glycosyltransferase family 2 protein, partial [Candidatus Levybacteria bacterium]|nr:glycosyltransferase family 2 protein [Candidatus Levybacteria bacterium]
MSLSIIILSYNTKDLVINCLKSLIGQYTDELEKGLFEIIVVDNASADNSFKTLSDFAKNHKNIEVIQSQENLGFGRGCNLGEEKAKGEYILFLNSDTQVNDRSFLEMLEFANSKNVGIVGGKIYFPDGKVQKSAGKFYTLPNFLLMILGFERLGFLKSSPDKIKKVDWVSGAFMLVKKSIFDKIGKFDKNIFMYIEDMELCFRAKKQGIQTYFFPQSKVFHREHGSSSRSFAIKNIFEEILY